jgi:hypothetical protein
MVLSELAVARFLPSGENTTALTVSVCPVRVASKLYSSIFQILTVRSTLPEAINFPSGEKATE